MQPLREAPSDAIAAFEAAAEAMGRARAAVRAALPMDRTAADVALAGVLAGGSLLLRGELEPRRALLRALETALGLDSAIVRASPGMAAAALIDRRAASLQGHAAMRPPLSHNLVLAERLGEAPVALRALLFEAAGAPPPEGWRRPDPFSLLITEPVGGLQPHETDRLLARIDLKAAAPGPASRAVSAGQLRAAQAVAAALPVGERVLGAALTLVLRARPNGAETPAALTKAVEAAPSPRAGQALLRMMRARALMDGRVTPSLEDLHALAWPVLEPRLGWREGADRRAVFGELLGMI